MGESQMICQHLNQLKSLRHFLTTCGLSHILLLINLPAVLWWAGIQKRAGLSNSDGYIVCDWRTYFSFTSTDFLQSIGFLFGWFGRDLASPFGGAFKWSMRLVAGARAGAVADIVPFPPIQISVVFCVENQTHIFLKAACRLHRSIGQCPVPYFAPLHILPGIGVQST